MGLSQRQLDVAHLPDHYDRLYRAAYALCGSREDAQDIVQETYVRVLRRPRFLRHEEDTAYLTRALRNTFLALRRARVKRPTTPMPTEELDWFKHSTSDPIGAVLDARAVFMAIRQLSESFRETIVAVDVVGLSYAETARALRIREGTVMSRLCRARQRVAEMLDT